LSTALSTWGRRFTAKKAIFAFLGPAFRIYGPEGNLQFYVKQKAFRLKEEINVFADEAQSKKRLTIKARSWGDFSGAYDVTDAESGEAVGACKREGLKSMFRDSWILLANEQPIARVQEDSMLMAMIRRFFLKGWIPQTFVVRSESGEQLGQIKQHFNPFQLNYDVNFEGDKAGALDPRLGIALVVLLLAIEGRQQ
jgi:uncharacterized protein YxjI